MMVSEHFSLTEFDQPARHGLPHVAYPPEWVDDRLYPLCEELETLRAYCGSKPVTIISGYRTPAYNIAVDGKPKSEHLVGRAADIVIEDFSPSDVVSAIEHLLVVGRFARIRGVGIYRTFTHIDIRPTMRIARWWGQRTAV